MEEKIKIAVIDDEPDYCEWIKVKIEETGEYDVVTCSKPEEAVDFVIEQKPGMILLDNIMPGKKGSEIARTLKKQDKLWPIIMVSGKGEMIFNVKKEDFKWEPNNPMAKSRGELPDARSASALAEAYGVDDYLAKPFTIEVLLGIIQETWLKYHEKKKEAEEDDMLPI